MKKFNFISFLIILAFLFILPYNNLFSNYKGSGDKKREKNTLQKTMDDPFQSLININNTTMWVSDAGFHDWVVASGWNGAFPNGTTVGAIFAEGIVWGGLVSDGSQPVVRVNGNTYATGTSAIIRLFRVRPDYLTGNLASDAASFNNISIGSVTDADINSLREQYAKDWNEWPAKGNPNSAYGDQAAPFKDVNEDGVYDPAIDIPGVPGASQTIFIKYDDSKSTSLYGSIPIGFEVTETYWAYAYSGALGNVIYKKVDFVYKGTPTSAANSRIDSMYIVQWADPDVGTSSDDFAGCDTSLNLGYAYSSGATDATYAGLGLAPPAVGYDFLQGVSVFTGNPSDSAIFNLEWRKGYKYVNRKPMSSYSYFAAGGAWSDPDFDYNGTLEFYNLMRGYLPIPRYPGASPFPATVADYTPDGTYLLAGDPVAGTGKLDGTAEGPGDRRIMVTNGPISLKLGDTAQVVLALVYGLGTDNKGSVAALKNNDLTAQIVFDQLFKLPSLDPPNVQIANLDRKVVLNWGANAQSVDKIEKFSDQGYSFEGYEVYQLPSSSSALEDGILLGTYDIINGVTAIYDTVIDANGVSIPKLAADGKDASLKRFFDVSEDKIRQTELRNGQDYYFAVVSYAYNPSPLLPFHVLRSPFVVLTTRPQMPLPGVRLSSSVGDTLKWTHSGTSDGSIIPLVVDPTRLTGHSYKVTFDTISVDDGTGFFTLETYWRVTDVTLNRVVADKQFNQTGDDDYPIVDGVLLKVLGPPPGIKQDDVNTSDDESKWGWSIPKGTRRFTWAGADGLGFEGFQHAIGWASPASVFGSGIPGIPADKLKKVLLKLARVPDGSVDYNPTFDLNDLNVSYGYRYGRGFAGAPVKPEFAPFIINAVGGYSYQDFTKSVPLSAWDITTNPTNPRRLAVGHLENNSANGLVDGKWWPGNNANFDNTAANGPREWLWIFDANYSETPNPEFQVEATGNPLPVMYFLTVNRRGAAPFSPSATGADEFEINPNFVNSLSDAFTFTAPAPLSSVDLAKKDIEKINVFPNPYYGYQYREIAPDNKYVTFSHLPENAVIRIFDLSGVLIRTIYHASTSGQFENWDLQNDNNYPIASGIYIVYIDMPDLGKTKILKLVVIQEQQMLKVY